MCDFLNCSRQVPLVAVERQVPLREVIEARQCIQPRPSWSAVFIKAYALVAERRAELRRAYLSFPWARLHQHACNVAHFTVARQIDGEEVVLTIQIRHPERLPLAEINARVRRAQSEPVMEIADFRRLRRVVLLPGPLRRLALQAGLGTSGNWRARFFGTFGVTSVATLGSTALIILSPMTTTLSYGVFAADGSLVVRLYLDHRVLDGVLGAEALHDLERTLRGPILDELRGLARSVA